MKDNGNLLISAENCYLEANQIGQLPIIMSSGYSDEPTLSKLKEIDCIALIPKPYLLHDLIGTVKAVISQRRQRFGTQG